MPELPEVETVKRSLENKIRGKTVQSMEFLVPGIIKRPSPEEFCSAFQGETFQGMGRRGKYLLFYLNSGKILVVHLRMTGQLIYCPPDHPQEKHLCLVFVLEDKQTGDISHLRYLDIRRFGCFYLLGPGESLPGVAKLGPEPLGEEFTLEYLKKALGNKKGKVKALLLDQELIAGIGNIYADEVLFRAGIFPEKPGLSLTEEEFTRLYQVIPEVLEESINKRGTTISDYLDSEGKKGDFQNYLQIYGRPGEACTKCGNLIQKTRVGGRSTCFCPHCQK